ncbi:MAG: hypothetical protein K9H26_18770 [Prolixibacteraceae bacterium]|nr:hypothetical protein [Prolixibacteraceae bacterium]
MKKLFMLQLLLAISLFSYSGYNSTGGTVYANWGDNPKKHTNYVAVNLYSDDCSTFYVHYDMVSDASKGNCSAYFDAKVYYEDNFVYTYQGYDGGVPLVSCDTLTVIPGFFIDYTKIYWKLGVYESNKYCSISVNMNW